jgi:predicted metal-dependent phosphoesterase TrpH
LKIDLHLHTHYSEDATTTLREVVAYAKKRRLDGVAVTDHDTTKGAQRLLKQKTKNFVIIPSVEVSSLQGHILAFNVEEPITPKLSLIETVEKIHQTGGIAVIAHPAVVLKTGLGHKISSASNIDAVEGINAAAFPFFLSNHSSHRLAQRLRVPETAGSDAHHPQEIGKAYTLVYSDSNREDIIEAIRKGKTTPFGKPIPWKLRFQRISIDLQIKVRGR